MAYFKVCPNCRARLDPCERCDCFPAEIAQLTAAEKRELLDAWKALPVRQHREGEGGVEQVAPGSTSSITETNG